MTKEKKRKDYLKQYHIKHRDVINERTRRHHFKYRYGITKEEALKLIDDAGGKCQICRNPFAIKNPAHIDHDHYTGKVRGALCRTCNNGLGFFKDEVHILKSAINYLLDE